MTANDIAILESYYSAGYKDGNGGLETAEGLVRVFAGLAESQAYGRGYNQAIADILARC